MYKKCCASPTCLFCTLYVSWRRIIVGIPSCAMKNLYLVKKISKVEWWQVNRGSVWCQNFSRRLVNCHWFVPCSVCLATTGNRTHAFTNTTLSVVKEENLETIFVQNYQVRSYWTKGIQRVISHMKPNWLSKKWLKTNLYLFFSYPSNWAGLPISTICSVIAKGYFLGDILQEEVAIVATYIATIHILSNKRGCCNILICKFGAAFPHSWSYQNVKGWLPFCRHHRYNSLWLQKFLFVIFWPKTLENLLASVVII